MNIPTLYIIILATLFPTISPDYINKIHQPKTAILRKGTEIELKLGETVTSKRARKGDRVKFIVSAPVRNGLNELIDGDYYRGVEAWGVVSEAEAAKSFGRKGQLDFDIEHTEAVDGQTIELSATSNGIGGSGRTLLSVWIGLRINPLGFLLKGENVEIESGATFKAYVAKDYTIELE